jgi:uncharacterized protein (TIGR04255 family)
MVLQLPDPVTDRLSRSPLNLVVCQVRHERNPAVSDAERVFAAHEAVKTEYPKVDESAAQDVGVLAGPVGIQAIPGDMSRGWRFRSKDDAWTAIVMPDFFALETTRYHDWDDYRARFEALAKAIEERLAPKIERRLGLRYVGRLVDPAVQKPEDWLGRVHPSLLGVLGHASLRPGVLMTQSLSQLEAPDNIQVLMRQGCIREPDLNPRWVYILDNDCFRESGQRFLVPDLMEGVEQLHTIALQVFQASVTQEYFNELLLGERP